MIFRKILKKAMLIATIAAVVTALWLLFFVTTTIVGVIVTFSALALALSFKKTRRFAPVLALSPCFFIPVLCSGKAIYDYSQGDAVLLYTGHPHGSNIDPTYRAPVRSLGCIVTGLNSLQEIPNNLVVKALITVFGFQKGAYRGRSDASKNSRERFPSFAASGNSAF